MSPIRSCATDAVPGLPRGACGQAGRTSGTWSFVDGSTGRCAVDGLASPSRRSRDRGRSATGWGSEAFGWRRVKGPRPGTSPARHKARPPDGRHAGAPRRRGARGDRYSLTAGSRSPPRQCRLAAAVVARAPGEGWTSYVLAGADPVVLERLEQLQARVVVCEREPGVSATRQSTGSARRSPRVCDSRSPARATRTACDRGRRDARVRELVSGWPGRARRWTGSSCRSAAGRSPRPSPGVRRGRRARRDRPAAPLGRRPEPPGAGPCGRAYDPRHGPPPGALGRGRNRPGGFTGRRARSEALAYRGLTTCAEFHGGPGSTELAEPSPTESSTTRTYDWLPVVRGMLTIRRHRRSRSTRSASVEANEPRPRTPSASTRTTRKLRPGRAPWSCSAMGRWGREQSVGVS